MPRAGLAAALALAACTTAAAEPAATVRLVEAGLDGSVPQYAAFDATFEVTAHRAFRGRLVVESGWLLTSRQVVPLDLDAGERHGVVARLATQHPSPELEWQLIAEGEVVVDHGKAKLEGIKSPIVLTLAAGEGPRWRRDPARAFASCQPYAACSAVVIGGADFASLSADQRQALLDSAALGSALIVVGDGSALPRALAEELAGSAAVAWRRSDGAEMREARWGSGLVRTTTVDLTTRELGTGLPFERFFTDPLPRIPSVLDVSLGHGAPWWFRDFAQVDGAAAIERASSEEHPIARPRRLALATAFTLAIGVPLLVLLGTRRARAPSPRAHHALAAIVLASPILVWIAFARRPLVFPETDVVVVRHDARGRVDVIERRREIGGGGGTVPPVVEHEESSRSTRWRPVRWEYECVLTVTHGDGGKRRAEPAPLQRSADQVLRLLTREVAPPTRQWQSQLRWERGRLVGSLTALTDFEHAVVLLPRRVVSLGRVAPGTVIDVGVLVEAALATKQSPARSKAEMDDIVLALEKPYLADSTILVRVPEPLLVVGRIGASKEGAGQRVVDVQPLHVDGPIDEAPGWVGFIAPRSGDASGITPRLPMVDDVLHRSRTSLHALKCRQGSWNCDFVSVDSTLVPCEDGFLCIEIASALSLPHRPDVLLAWKQESSP